MNLAENLTRTASRAPRPGGDEARRGRAHLPPARLRRRRGSRTCCRARGSRPATGSGSCSPTSPISPSLLLRRPPARRGGGADERAAEAARGRLLPHRPGAKLLFAWHGFAEAAEAGAEEAGAELILVEPGEFEQLVGEFDDSFEVADRDDDDTAVILYTSGTTGTPKGAELTHANLARNVAAFADFTDIDESSVVLGALPLFHSFGQTCGLNAAIRAGACLRLIPRFDPARRWRSSTATGSACSRGCRRCTRRCCTTPSGRASTPRG